MRKILLVEDHPIMRSGINFIFQGHPRYKVSGEASNKQQALQKIKEDSFDIVLLDLSLPDGFGLDLLPSIRESQPNCEVIVLSMHSEEPYIAKALAQGASGYVLKDMASEKLIDVIESVERGERVFHFFKPKIELNANGIVSFDRKRTPAKLSARERAVMEHIHQGKSLTEIGTILGLSVKTVYTYRVRLMQKLGLSSHEELESIFAKSAV